MKWQYSRSSTIWRCSGLMPLLPYDQPLVASPHAKKGLTAQGATAGQGRQFAQPPQASPVLAWQHKISSKIVGLLFATAPVCCMLVGCTGCALRVWAAPPLLAIGTKRCPLLNHPYYSRHQHASTKVRIFFFAISFADWSRAICVSKEKSPASISSRRPRA